NGPSDRGSAKAVRLPRRGDHTGSFWIADLGKGRVYGAGRGSSEGCRGGDGKNSGARPGNRLSDAQPVERTGRLRLSASGRLLRRREVAGGRAGRMLRAHTGSENF